MNLLYIFYVLNKHKGILCAFAEEINLLRKKKNYEKAFLLKRKRPRLQQPDPSTIAFVIAFV